MCFLPEKIMSQYFNLSWKHKTGQTPKFMYFKKDKIIITEPRLFNGNDGLDYYSQKNLTA
jgi:hypothetical protein